MNASKFFLKAANSLITAVVALFLILAAAYSGYALWDNAQVYAAVDDVQSELMKLKPDPEQKDGGASFEELELLTLGSLRKAVMEGDVVNGSVMAGQIAGLIHEEKTCKEIIEGMMKEAEALLGAKA